MTSPLLGKIWSYVDHPDVWSRTGKADLTPLEVVFELTRSVECNVERGVTWLNDNVPDWLDIVDVDRLDMGSETDCLLAQLYGGNYFNAPEELTGRPTWWMKSNPTLADQGANAVLYGFDVWRSDLHAKPDDPVELTAVWRRTIIRLRRERRPQDLT